MAGGFRIVIELFGIATDGEREAAGLLSSSSSRINNGTGTTTRSQEMVYHAAEELLLNHQQQQQQNELSDDQPRRRSVNLSTYDDIIFVVGWLRVLCTLTVNCPFILASKSF